MSVTALTPNDPRGKPARKAIQVGPLGHEEADGGGRPVRVALRNLLQGGWRRRRLIALPVLIMLPISVAAFMLMPGDYVARTLLMLQETGRDTLTVREPAGSIRLRERLNGLEALLKSDQVLGKAAVDVASEEVRSDPKRMAGLVRGLRQSLSIETVGTDFIEIKLKGGKAEGLGRELEWVTARFVEMLMPDQTSGSIGQLLIDRRRDNVEQAQAALSGLEARIAQMMPDGEAANARRLSELDARIAAKTAEIGLREAEVARAESDRQGALAEASRGGGDRSWTEQVREAWRSGRDGLASLVGDRGPELQELDAQLAALKAERDAAGQAAVEYVALLARLEPARKAVRIADDAYQSFLKRYGTTGSPRSVGILSAPERIRVVDPPTDPILPARSRLMYILAGLGGSLILGVTAAWIAEMLDGRIRHPEEFTATTGVPVLAILPSSDGLAGRGAAAESGGVGRTLLLLVVLAVLASAATWWLRPDLVPAEVMHWAQPWLTRLWG